MNTETAPRPAVRTLTFEQWMKGVACLTARNSPDAMLALLAMYYEQGWRGKAEVLSAFRAKADKQIYPALEQALRNNENANLRNAGMEIYIGLGDRSLPALTALLGDADEEVRTFTCVMLGSAKLAGAVPRLIDCLADPDLNVKHAAAEALGLIRDRRAVEPLIAALNGDMWLQFPAATALGELGDPRAVGPLRAMLDVPGANVPAIQALGKIGDASVLGDISRFLEEDEPSLREWALEAVAAIVRKHPRLADPGTLSGKAEGLLIETLGSDSAKARRNAVVALGRYKTAAAAPHLTKLLEDPELREEVLDAIVRIGGESALREVESFTRDSDPLVRRAAVVTLAGLGSAKSVGALLPLLTDADEDVRMEAMLALARFNSDEARSALDGTLSEMSAAAREAQRKALDAYATITTREGSPFSFFPDDVAPLRDFIAERLGLYFDEERLHVLHLRLSPLAASAGFTSLQEFHRHLAGQAAGSELMVKLAARLANNETYFFREMAQLNAFITNLVPGLVERKLRSADKTIRVLSAGCSTGEEAYTLAMLLEEAGVRRQGCALEVVGLDIDHAALDVARSGVYTARSLRGEDRGLAERYLRREQDRLIPREEIKSTVRFHQGNLMEDPRGMVFDAIFCRNVLIYFSDRATEAAANNFQRLLRPGGYVLLGHSESFCRIATDLAPIRLEGAVVYKKCEP